MTTKHGIRMIFSDEIVREYVDSILFIFNFAKSC